MYGSMPASELDAHLMGSLVTTCSFTPKTTSRMCNTPKTREKCYTSFFHQGEVICKRMILFLFGIGKKRFRNVQVWLYNNGPCA